MAGTGAAWRRGAGKPRWPRGLLGACGDGDGDGGGGGGGGGGEDEDEAMWVHWA